MYFRSTQSVIKYCLWVEVVQPDRSLTIETFEPSNHRTFCNKSTINVIRIIYLIFYNIYSGVFTVVGIHRFPIYLRVIDMLGRQFCTRDILLCF